MDWGDVRVFLAVAQHGNLRDAGATLGISQPTAGRRLQALERQLGIALFQRGRRGHALTSAGAALLPSAEAMAEAAAELARHGGGLGRADSGPVRITATDWAATFLARRLPAEGLTVELVVSEATAILARRDADLAVRHGLPETGEYLTRKVGRMAVAAYGARSYLAAVPEARGRGRYTAADWVTFTEEQAHLQTMRWLLPRLGQRTPAARASTTALIAEAVAAGAGLGLLPCFIGDDDPRLSRVDRPIASQVADYWLIVPRELSRLARVRRAIDWVADCFATHRRNLMGDASAVGPGELG